MTGILEDYQVLFVFKLLFHTWLSGGTKRIGQPVYLPHDLLPRLIHLKEHLGLCRQLPLNIWSVKNAFQVQPVSLAVQPLFLGEKYGQEESFNPKSTFIKNNYMETHGLFPFGGFSQVL